MIRIKNPLLTIMVLVAASVPAAFADTNTAVLREVWDLGSRNACTREMRASFDAAAFERVRAQVGSETDREQLKAPLNEFLRALGWSHTEFMTARDESFYFFRGHSSSMNPEHPSAPLLINPGIQIGRDDAGFFVREVLDGFPAKIAGALRLDRIVSWRGLPFAGTWGADAGAGELVVRRGPFEIALQTSTEALNWNDAFLAATHRSEKIFDHAGKRIGYVRLWSGVHKDSAAALRSIVERLAGQNIDGLVLDLRGGYGGAWWQHLEPFFADNTDFFRAETFEVAAIFFCPSTRVTVFVSAAECPSWTQSDCASLPASHPGELS